MMSLLYRLRLRTHLRAPVCAAAIVLAGTAVFASAQQGRRGAGWCFTPEECPHTTYDGRFTFMRVYFETRGGGGLGSFRGGRGGGEPPWHHDRPHAERNLSSILREVSFLRTFDGEHGGNVFAMDDPEMFRYPVAWIAEPGFWQPSEPQVEAFREYLLKGGFAIFDDFRGPHWYNFEAQMQRVLPELTPIRLMGSEPVFRTFFDIDMAALNVQAYNEMPEYWGYFEDNDTAKRMLAVVNYNNDIGEFMEYSGTGFFPVDLTNEAYKLGVNYIMYALTH